MHLSMGLNYSFIFTYKTGVSNPDSISVFVKNNKILHFYFKNQRLRMFLYKRI